LAHAALAHGADGVEELQARDKGVGIGQMVSGAGRSDRARGPIIASALWIRGTVEHFARAAIRGFGSSGEITATATRLTGIRRLLRVMAQFALSILGRAKGAGIGADEILLVFSVPN
jgi:hypothetical protein